MPYLEQNSAIPFLNVFLVISVLSRPPHYHIFSRAYFVWCFVPFLASHILVLHFYLFLPLIPSTITVCTGNAVRIHYYWRHVQLSTISVLTC